jgi:hypothetical protein
MKELLKQGQEPKPTGDLAQSAVVIGRIGGVFMASNPLTPEQQMRLEEITQRIDKHQS